MWVKSNLAVQIAHPQGIATFAVYQIVQERLAETLTAWIKHLKFETAICILLSLFEPEYVI